MSITRPARARGDASAAADLPPLDRSLTYRLHRLHKLSDRDSAAAYLAECGLPLGEGRCLAAVGAFEPLSVQDLARAANLDKGQASRSAQALVERGLVEKLASPNDGRGVVLRLSARGRTVWRRAMRMIGRRNAQIFACLTPAEQAVLGGFLDRLIAHAGSGAKPAEATVSNAQATGAAGAGASAR